MYIIGITGPSGAGKTTALRVLESMGGKVFDCDAIYHALLRTDGELLGRIEAAFPGAVKDYALDRKALGAKVFADPVGLDKLTAITQPIVAKRVLEEIQGLERPSSVTSVRTGDSFPPGGRQFAVIDAIGLFESGLGEKCDLTVAVVADPETRVRRLMARDGISEDYARARIAAQKPSEYYTAQAGLVLENNGTETEFAEKCRVRFETIIRQRM
ncbi:MAG: dephospho-CoA kinase [Oscillospiraceae bacterium]|nr:dephospho-CoA kinase [Oscillospiraceae bacterium]